MAVTVVVADDQALVRSGLITLLEADADIDVVGEAADGSAAVDTVRSCQPDVVLMDVRMPGTDGLAATRTITSDNDLRNTRVVVLTTYELDEYVFEALQSGASGFLTKDVDAQDLRDAVRLVAEGQALLSPSVTRRVVDTFAGRSAPAVAPERLDVLTTREAEVLELVGRGLTNAEIADALFMSPLTAKTHVSRIIGKVGARDRVQLVVLAYETGLVDRSR